MAARSSAIARRAVRGASEPLPPLRPLRHPVVLLHGFGAVASVGRGALFRAEALHLRQRGVWAYAPQTNPYDTLDARVATWAHRLGEVLDETGADRLNLIGFSTGGLDARLLAASPDWRDRIASVLTVATPHRGTPLATYVLERPERLRAAVLGVMDTLGRAAFAAAPPNTLEAVAELTPEAVTARLDPDATLPGILCASYAARAGRGTEIPIHPALVLTNRILHRRAGQNDGIVPTASAWWGEHLARLDADHARLAGIALTASAFRSLDFYASVCDLLRARGL
jgi:triacylglycerol lipase